VTFLERLSSLSEFSVKMGRFRSGTGYGVPSIEVLGGASEIQNLVDEVAALTLYKLTFLK
jgi:hypothetical protein